MWRLGSRQSVCAVVLGNAIVARAIQFNLGDPNSAKSAAAEIAYNMMTQYTGNQTGQIPGILPDLGQIPNGYFWWEGGEMFGALIDYWMYTGDSSYNPTTAEALAFQAGENSDYFPRNQTFDEGNDDQAFWAMAALTAAEMKFESPPKTSVNTLSSWIGGAQAVFNQQWAAVDNQTCGGGLRWAKQSTGTGWDQKTTVANLGFVNVAARLGLYLNKDPQYLSAAETIYDWCVSVGLVDRQSGAVYDGVSVDNNCSQIDRPQWSYNAGTALQAAAALWNATSDQKWHDEVDLIVKGLDYFVQDGAIVERNCENNPADATGCTMDQKSFKNVLVKGMAVTAKYCPWTAAQLDQMIGANAQAAAKACVCGTGNQCPLAYTGDSNANCNGDYGIGQQMDALEAIISTLNPEVAGPVTQSTGGTSQSDPNAGSGTSDSSNSLTQPAKTSDKAGGAILTIVVVLGWLGGCVFLLWP